MPEHVSILMVNGGFSLAAIFRLQGTLRFMRDSSMSKLYYLAVIIIVLICLLFYYLHDNVLLRNFALSVFLAAVAGKMAFEFIAYAPAKG